MEVTSASTYILPLFDLLDFVESEIQTLPLSIRYQIDRIQVVFYILEELNVALADKEALSAIDQSVAYLVQRGIESDVACRISFAILHCTINLVAGYFPKMTYLELSNARFVIVDENSLRITLTNKF